MQVMDEWIAAVGPNKFLGGDLPSRPDLEVLHPLAQPPDVLSLTVQLL